ncbi:MAG: Fe-S cluster assembly protein SufD [Gammaproteobacteria bacterium]
MAAALPETQPLLDAHARMRASDTAAPTSLAQRQSSAMERFAQSGFPGPREEDWRYTNLRAFRDAPLVAANASGAHETTLPFPAWLWQADPVQLAAPPTAPAGVTALRLRDALAANHPLCQQLGVSGANGALIDLNDAFAADAVLLSIDSNTELSEPLIIDWQLATDALGLSSPRLLMHMGVNSKATLVERRIGRGGFSNSLSELLLEDGARMQYISVARDNASSHGLTRVDAQLARDAALDSFNLSLGGTLTRNDMNVALNAPGARVSLCGTFVAGKGQHIDNHTSVDHVSELTHSVENYRGIIGRAGHGVFNGKVIVRENAQKITSAQSNDNLLLDDSAQIDTKPELQIYADDVRCSHGATVGRLDEQALFYLRSRGLDPQTAQRLLLDAFARSTLSGLEPAMADALGDTLTEFLASQVKESSS